ncbi:glycerophosphodiester phosphodiesterase [Nocardioides coralli]|uniref:glycerophosphodiester phosphodiesterase n=1 Tax=Nocardioides coralli TaxID=2872154 RepID=UPI001CA397F1|nr:glycerophosphodiester phosphodiesterase family protein [Nocardioides coralli]QZY30614.1 hypothetical protein K6T13_08240 [Nocardioides coralli]
MPTVPAEAARACQNIAHRAIYQGTEEQVRGVRRNAKWGFTEIDARVTADQKVVAVHDSTLERTSGGATRARVEGLTLQQIRRKRYVLGRRVETTRRLITEAARTKSSIMVTINSYARYRDAWDDYGLQTLWNAAQTHPKPSKVYFGGAGAEKAMRNQFPAASTFHRYKGRDSDILSHAVDTGVALAALPPAHFDPGLVSDLRAAGIRVASVQLNRKKSVRRANAAGIRLVQTDHSRKTVRKWCR